MYAYLQILHSGVKILKSSCLLNKICVIVKFSWYFYLYTRKFSISAEERLFFFYFLIFSIFYWNKNNYSPNNIWIMQDVSDM